MAGFTTGAIIGAAAASQPTTVVVGTTVNALPSNCVATVVGYITYEQCGTVWYQPQYVGNAIQYVVVNPPR